MGNIVGTAPGFDLVKQGNTMNIGTIQRAKAAIAVLRGWDPNGAQNRETVAPIRAGHNIMSGMVCSLLWNSALGYEDFVIGWSPVATAVTAAGTANASTAADWTYDVNAIPHFAKYDYNDTMITSSGLFSALSCADNYELQTAYFRHTSAAGGATVAGTAPTGATIASTYSKNAWLTADISDAGLGYVVPVASGTCTVLGKLSKHATPIDVGPGNSTLGVGKTVSNVAVDANGEVLVIQLQTNYQKNLRTTADV